MTMVQISRASLETLHDAACKEADALAECGEEVPQALDEAIEQARSILFDNGEPT